MKQPDKNVMGSRRDADEKRDTEREKRGVEREIAAHNSRYVDENSF